MVNLANSERPKLKQLKPHVTSLPCMSLQSPIMAPNTNFGPMPPDKWYQGVIVDQIFSLMIKKTIPEPRMLTYLAVVSLTQEKWLFSHLCSDVVSMFWY